MSTFERFFLLHTLRASKLKGFVKTEALIRKSLSLSSGALKRHIDVLTEVGLIGKSNSHYRITQSGLGLLTQIDQVIEKMKEILSNKEQMKEILTQQ